MPNLALLARFRASLIQLTPPTLRVSKRKRAARAIEDNPSIQSTPHALTVAQPIAVASSSTALTGVVHTRSSSRISRVPKAIAKDTLLLSLEALAQSADAFPPLKSAVGGFLFIVAQIDLVSSNKGRTHDIYAQIDGFAASLVRAIPDVTALSPTAKEAIRALANDVAPDRAPKQT